MKKVKFEFKYIMIILVVIAGVMLAVSGSFNETKTQTAYRTTVDGTDSVRVAKWDVVGLTRNEGANLNLNVGFTENIISGGDWYFDVQNKSEVIAKISDSSSIKLRLFHSSFNNDDYSTRTWNFLGSVNPFIFTIEVYPNSATELLFYQNGSTEISYDEYVALSVAERKAYTEVFKGTAGTEVLKTSASSVFKKVSENGEYFYECEFNLNALSAELEKFDYNESLTFRVHWDVQASCVHEDTNNDKKCDICGHCSHSDTNSDNICDSCGNIVNIDGKYNKYIISKSIDAIEGYERIETDNTFIDPSASTEGGESKVRYLFKSTSSQIDFFEYQKYTSTLGGEPFYEFLNESGTQTELVAHSKLSDSQILSIKNYVYSSTNNDIQKVWEHYTYEQYEKFIQELASTQDSLSYMAFGAKLQIVFNLTVEQVD